MVPRKASRGDPEGPFKGREGGGTQRDKPGPQAPSREGTPVRWSAHSELLWKETGEHPPQGRPSSRQSRQALAHVLQEVKRAVPAGHLEVVYLTSRSAATGP